MGDKEKKTTINDWMIRIAFAEAGEHDIAREYLQLGRQAPKGDLRTACGVKVWFGTAGLGAEQLALCGVRVWSGTATFGAE